MASIFLYLNLKPFLSSDVINIIIRYATINCKNCTKEKSDFYWSNNYKKCNRWLCVQCDSSTYFPFFY